MYRKRTVTCRDCGTAFETAAVNAVRCKDCQKKHRNECEKIRKRSLAARYRETPDDRKEFWKNSEIEFLNLPDPWNEGRLPESVTKNQLWGMP